MLRVLSLGAGVQSSTVLLMSCKGVLAKLDGAVFANTGWESPATYEHLERIIAYARSCGIPVHKRGKGTIRSDALSSFIRGHVGDGSRALSMPYFTEGENGERGMIKRQCTRE